MRRADEVELIPEMGMRDRADARELLRDLHVVLDTARIRTLLAGELGDLRPYLFFSRFDRDVRAGTRYMRRIASIALGLLDERPADPV